MALGHQLSGTAAGILLAPMVPHPEAPWATPAFVVLTTICALVPDMDQPGSKLSRSLGPVTWALSWIIGWLSRLFYEATKTSTDRPGGNGHRTLTHTLAWCVFLGLTTTLVMLPTGAHDWALWTGLGVFTGNVAHIWGDAMTLHGVPFWAPVMRGGKRWALVHVWPKPLWFRAGGHKVKNRLKDRSRFAWVNFGEAVVTAGLVVVVCLFGALTLISGGGPWWDGIATLMT